MAEAIFVGAITGAAVGALLTAVIDKTKSAVRCKENCENLRTTLEEIRPLLDRVDQSKDGNNATCQAWLRTVNTLLEKADRVLGKCTTPKKSIFHLQYVTKWHLSSSIKDVDRQIKEKLPQVNLLTLDIVQLIYQILTGQSMVSPGVDTSKAFVMQAVPEKIVIHENNPFQKMKELIISVADLPSREPVTFGLKGRGGAGKTLLAKMVNNDTDIQAKYGAGSVLWITIGKDASIPSTYKTMARFLGCGDVYERDYTHRRMDDQRTYLMEAFKRKRVLLILDDVWEWTWENRSIIYWLDICKGVGSTTLITTRNDSVLHSAKANERIDILSLSEEESWKLFSYHAFQTSIPPQGELESLAKQVCGECKGLPLALEVIGGALWEKKDISHWRFALSRLKRSESMCNSKVVDDELFHRLKFSYDELDDDVKKCFLYFAAFPEDMEIKPKKLCSIWQAEGLFGTHDDDDAFQMGWMALTALADRSLIDLFEKNGEKYAKVHDVLRDLAIRIIREAKAGEWASECFFEPGKVLETLPTIKEGIKRVSFIGSTFKHFDSSNKLQFASIQVCLLSEMSFQMEHLGSPKDMRLVFLSYIFSSMSQLLYLDLSSCKSLKELPEGIKELKCLMHLNLSKCYALEKLPEGIKELKCLTHLNLSYCISLKELPKGIKELKSLTHLDLSGSEFLKELPEGIKELKCLMHLDLSFCNSLKKLPEGIKELKCLTHLNLSYCISLKELPKGIKELKCLTHLDLSGSEFLKELPEGIKELKCLMHLDLSFCNSLEKLPEGIKELKCLTHLNLSRCRPLKELPEGIKELKCLTHLVLSWCSSLKELPEGIKELKCLTHLNLRGCLSLKELPEGIKELKCLTHLNLRGCLSLKELPKGMKELKCLTHLDLSGCTSLKELPEGIKELKCLTYLDLIACRFLAKLPKGIEELKCLTHLNLSHCTSLKELPKGIKELKCLMHLDLSWCYSLRELPEGIKELKCLTHFHLSGCTSLKELPEGIKELKCLTHLNLSVCTSLKELPEDIKELKCLTHLNLSGCTSLKELPEGIKRLKCLTHFYNY